jgi:hypothetical protein
LQSLQLFLCVIDLKNVDKKWIFLPKNLAKWFQDNKIEADNKIEMNYWSEIKKRPISGETVPLFCVLAKESALTLGLDQTPLFVGELSNYDHNEINQRPDSKTAECQQH